jgi:hypothetical protein
MILCVVLASLTRPKLRTSTAPLYITRHRFRHCPGMIEVGWIRLEWASFPALLAIRFCRRDCRRESVRSQWRVNSYGRSVPAYHE